MFARTAKYLKLNSLPLGFSVKSIFAVLSLALLSFACGVQQSSSDLSSIDQELIAQTVVFDQVENSASESDISLDEGSDCFFGCSGDSEETLDIAQTVVFGSQESGLEGYHE